MTNEKIIEAEQERLILDEWPRFPDDTDWNGRDLLVLLNSGRNPFGDALDVKSLIHEIESCLRNGIAEIPLVTYGANHFVRKLECHLSSQAR